MLPLWPNTTKHDMMWTTRQNTNIFQYQLFLIPCVLSVGSLCHGSVLDNLELIQNRNVVDVIKEKKKKKKITWNWKLDSQCGVSSHDSLLYLYFTLSVQTNHFSDITLTCVLCSGLFTDFYFSECVALGGWPWPSFHATVTFSTKCDVGFLIIWAAPLIKE